MCPAPMAMLSATCTTQPIPGPAPGPEPAKHKAAVQVVSLDCTCEAGSRPGPVEDYASEEGKARQQGTLRSLAGQFTGVPDVISLSAGFPPPHLFPLAGISLRLADGTQLELAGPCAAAAQQYNSGLRGYAPLLQWATRHVAALHRPPAAHDVLITNGGNHALELITSLFLDRGDALLLEEYAYPVLTESIAHPKGYRTLSVPMDDAGIVPSGLRAVLHAAAAAAASGGPDRPKLLYTVPTGHNPTGCTTSDGRRREIYQICREYDVWILEDDPYYYLQWGVPSSSLPCLAAAGQAALEAAMPGLHGLAAAHPSAPCHSYLSLDRDQRVIRVDSMSKFMAPGMRLGWVTARADVIAKLTSALHAHTVGPCSLSQAVAGALLEAWGDAGLEAHLRRVQGEYARRCAITLAAADRELAGVAEWTAPNAGMFLWLRLTGVRDAGQVWEDVKQAKVVVCPGGVMRCDGRPSACLRISFSAASEEQLEEGMARLGRVLRARQAAAVQGEGDTAGTGGMSGAAGNGGSCLMA